jgi:hypothetical protein
MARSTYFDLSRSADACLGSESGYAQRFQCGNVVKPLIWTGMILHVLEWRKSRVVPLVGSLESCATEDTKASLSIVLELGWASFTTAERFRNTASLHIARAHP